MQEVGHVPAPRPANLSPFAGPLFLPQSLSLTQPILTQLKLSKKSNTAHTGLHLTSYRAEVSHSRQ